MACQPGEALIPRDAAGNALIDNETDLADTWKEMEKLVGLGLTKAIGISNFNSKQIDYILSKGTIPPAVNQVSLLEHSTYTT